MDFGRRGLAWLVGWYALYQAVHIPVNLRALARLAAGATMDFPAPPPAGGWSPDAVAFFAGMASLDLGNALLALVFTWGFYRRRGWAMPLGLITLTVSLYAALLFAYATHAAGAWRPPGRGSYLLIYTAFLPVVALYAVLLGHALRGLPPRGREGPTSSG